MFSVLSEIFDAYWSEILHQEQWLWITYPEWFENLESLEEIGINLIK